MWNPKGLTKPVDGNSGFQSSNSFVVIAYFSLLAISLIPVVTVHFPESVDYLNHLGRMFVLAVPDEHTVRDFYMTDWRLIPNLGLEFLVLGLNKLMPLEAAMKAGWIFIFLSLPAAFYFFYLALNRRIDAPLLLSALCFFNCPLTAGFLSFSLGLAASVAIVGLWFRFGGRLTLRNLLLLNALSVVILLVHFAAFAALAFTIVCLHALHAPWRPTAIIKRAIVASFSFLAPLLLLTQMSNHTGSLIPDYYYWGLLDKPILPLFSVFTGVRAADAVGSAALIVSLYVIVRLGSGRCDARLAPTLIAWLLVLILLPKQIDNSAAIDTRLVLFPVLLFFGSLSAPSGRLSWIVSGIVVVAVCVRVALIQLAWQQYNSDITDLRSLGRFVEYGSKIFVEDAAERQADCDERFRWPPFYDHAPVLFLLDRHAFIPLLFANAGMQPIRLKEEFKKIAAWPNKYDYLLLRSINCAKDKSPDNGLTFLGESKAYKLYRIPRDRED